MKKEILSSTQLVDKVSILKESIKADGLNEHDNLGQMLNTNLDTNNQPIYFRDKIGVLKNLLGVKDIQGPST